MGFIANIIRKSLGGSYKQVLVDPYVPHKPEEGEELEEKQEQPPQNSGKSNKKKTSVAVIGGGLAGITTAIQLLEKKIEDDGGGGGGGRLFDVTIYESNEFIGGKCGAHPKTLLGTRGGDGEDNDCRKSVHVSHGFHGIFPQYYNCRGLLKKVGIMPNSTKKADDYMIIKKKNNKNKKKNNNDKEGREVYSFKNLKTTPLLSIYHMWRLGMYDVWPIATSPKRIRYLLETIRYSPERTTEKFNDVTFREWIDECKMPDDLVTLFTAITRSFFAEPEDICMADLIEAFHFYFTSNDGGLVFDIVLNDYHESFVRPMTDYVTNELGGTIFTETLVRALNVLPSKSNKTPPKIEVVAGSKNKNNDGDVAAVYDYAVLACDVAGVQKIMSSDCGRSSNNKNNNSSNISKLYPDFVRNVRNNVKPGSKYAVLKLWMNKRIRNDQDYPPYFMVEKIRVMDSISPTHTYESCSENWASQQNDGSGGGAVYELHCYSLPSSLLVDKDDDEAEAKRIEELFLLDLYEYFPELRDAKILEKDLVVQQNFTALHVGLNRDRPGVDTPVPCLKFAGDWVKIPTTAKLMEGAVISGMMAANHILMDTNRDHPIEPDTIYCVPPRGMLAGSGRGKEKKEKRKEKATHKQKL